MSFVLAIDQGTSSTKALVVDAVGNVLSCVEMPVTIHATSDGGVEVDPDELWDSVVEAGTAAIRAAPVLACGLVGVGLANQGETVLGWNPHGDDHGTGIVWQDARSSVICDEVRSSGQAGEIARVSGLELDPYFVAPKIVWLRRHHGERRSLITTTDAWLLWKLGGGEQIVTDAATASRTALLDLDTRQWSPALAELFGLSSERLPEIVACDEKAGETDVFTPGHFAAVGGTIVDQQAALWAQSCLRPGEVKCTYGTGAFLLANTGSVSPARRSTAGLVACVAWSLRDGTYAYCFDGQVFTAGAAVSWLEAVGLIETAADLDGIGGQVDDAGTALFVPALAGLGSPYWSPNALASFTGLSQATTQAHLVRSVLEGVCAHVAELADACAADMGSAVTTLRVDGGLTRSRVLLQAQADLSQTRIEVYPSPHATALGVAALAWRSVDPTHPGFVWSPSAVYEPRWSADRAAEVRGRWRAAALHAAEVGR